MSALIYELWDQESGNCVGSYENLESALADVRDLIDRYGRASAETLALLSSDAEEVLERVAIGDDLIERAVAAVAAVSYLGVGLYTIRDAARIIKAKPSDLRRWLRRDKYQSHGKTYRRLPFVARMLLPDADAVTFSELMELRVIRELRQEGISMARIRRFSAQLAEEFGTDFPLSFPRFVEEYQHDGTYIYARPSGRRVRERNSGQLAMFNIVAPLLRDIEFSQTGTALQYWPLSRRSRVVLDAQRQFGQPIDAPSGYPTRVLYMATKANPTDGPDVIARWYDVEPEAVRDAVAYETSLAA